MTLAADLVAVYCDNVMCRERLRTGRPMLVGMISAVARLKCPSCRGIATYRAESVKLLN